MFSRATGQTIRRIRGTRGVATSSVLRRFDKSILYPTLLVVFLGSQILNVMNAQKSVEDLERRYNLKMTKIDEIKERLANGEKIDVQEEMFLVNKLFERSKESNKAFLKTTSDKFGSNFGVLKTPQADTVESSGVFDSLDGDLSDDALNKLLGLDPVTSGKDAPAEVEEPKTLEVLSQEQVQFHIKNEKELLDYKLNPHRHVIVEIPGDYVSAAKDTKVSKFL